MTEVESTNPFERLFGQKLGRAAERFTLAPVTRLKLLLQTQNYHIRNGKLPTPLSFLGWISLLLQSNGFTSLYSGSLLMLLKVEAALWLGDWIKKQLIINIRSHNDISALIYIMKIVLFGLFYPLDTIVTRVMAHPDASTLAVLSNAFSSQNSLLSLYNGFGIGFIGLLASSALSSASRLIFQTISSKFFYNYPGRVRFGTLRWIFNSIPSIGTYFLDTIMRELMLSDRTDLSRFNCAKTVIEQHGIGSLYGGCLFYFTFSAIQTFTLGFIDVVARFKFPR